MPADSVGQRSAWHADSELPLVVLDTNVWLDLYFFRDPAVAPLAQALQCGAVQAVRSDRTDAELCKVLVRPPFAAKLPPASVTALLARWRGLARRAEADRCAPWSCHDPDDQKFLDLAYSTQARTLYTKDRALLRLARCARQDGLRIEQPRAPVSPPRTP